MLAKLGRKLPSATKARQHNPPFVFTLIKKCKTHQIPYELMCRLNYYDLLYLIIEYDIEAVEEHLRQLEARRLKQQGVDEVVEATNVMILRMHRN